ncbi:hypothetical protein C900_00711 [Fulvivirga imtechensis AK7]|uniref:Uncharacterized protein n=1 Tax=Fulvivirga imtechensis AK7 TaxID=1237149 RepID=L8JH34_9BACT|nr:hypothetical protein C900_00711 [Fulvivirga imtechensis AK7]
MTTGFIQKKLLIKKALLKGFDIYWLCCTHLLFCVLGIVLKI